MKMIFAGAGVLFAAGALYGQLAVTSSGGLFQFAGAANGEVQVFGFASIGSQVVTGKPFSATEDRRSRQLLGDGTHIETKETNRLFRDDQGRTRIERLGGAVTIMDPVAGFTAELHPGERTFSKSALLVREGRVVGRGVTFTTATPPSDAAQLKDKTEKLEHELADARSSKTEANPDVKRLEAQLADTLKATAGSQSNLDDFKARTATPYVFVTGKEVQIKTATGPAAAVPRVGTGDNGAVESLPAQMVNGAMAEGTRRTETIPVGKIGNDRAISIVDERWFSNDLQMLVKSTNSDPRFGDTTYQLTNIVQTSPDPSLFQVPADYTLRK
jgi:hypothetical protein